MRSSQKSYPSMANCYDGIVLRAPAAKPVFRVRYCHAWQLTAGSFYAILAITNEIKALIRESTRQSKVQRAGARCEPGTCAGGEWAWELCSPTVVPSRLRRSRHRYQGRGYRTCSVFAAIPYPQSEAGLRYPAITAGFFYCRARLSRVAPREQQALVPLGMRACFVFRRLYREVNADGRHRAEGRNSDTRAKIRGGPSCRRNST